VCLQDEREQSPITASSRRSSPLFAREVCICFQYYRPFMERPAQSPIRRSHAVARRCADDATDHRGGVTAWYFGARSHCRRQGGTRELERIKIDLKQAGIGLLVNLTTK